MTPTDPWLTLATRQVNLRATYDSNMWVPNPHDPDGDDDLYSWSGFCDPDNPWGTADKEPRTEEPCTGDSDPIVKTLPLLEAVEFIVEFPGAVWDLWEGEASQDYHTGVYTRVWLHVDTDPYELLALVFQLADDAQKRADRHLRNILRNRNS